MAKQALGKGLGALFNQDPINIDNSSTNTNKEGIAYLPLDSIVRNPNQPRKSFDEKEIINLSNSIKNNGVIQPIIVVKQNNQYMIVAGERRFLASKKANLKTIPSIIKDFTEEEIYEIALIENIQRENLNPVEEALGFKALIDKWDFTHEQISTKLGKSRTYITNSLRLLNLNIEERNLLSNNTISKGHAIALLQLDNEKQRKETVDLICEKGLSVRETENHVKNIKKQKKLNNSEKPLKSVFIKDIEEKMTEKYNTKVEIKGSLQKGKIVIEYYSKEDLEKFLN